MPKTESESNQAKQNAASEEPTAVEKTYVQDDKLNALEELVRRLLTGEQIPSMQKTATLGTADNESAEIQDLKKKINLRLTGEAEIPNSRAQKFIKPISVPMPECTDVLLSLINTVGDANDDEITAYFKDYFRFCDNSVASEEMVLEEIIDPKLLDCTGKWFPNVRTTDCETQRVEAASNQRSFQLKFPPFWCLPPSCVKIAGSRHLYEITDEIRFGKIRRLFIADLVWLFYFDRMGIFKILGAILDDYAIKGKLPLSNGSVNAAVNKGKDDHIALVLESMVRKTKIGLSSTVRDRNVSYRRGIGWVLDEGRGLNLDTVVNDAFTNLFHKFIQTTLEFYKDKRLATAIQGINSPVSKTSVATLISIKDTIGLLKKAFDPFDYGRNYSHTLHGIVWAISGMALIRDLRTTLGIPPEYDKPYEYIPAAYDILIKQSQIMPSESNRYNLHRDCANNARDILLDLEVIDQEKIEVGGELELWINLIEGKVEGYRTAYRSLTGIDLGDPQTAKIEQKV